MTESPLKQIGFSSNAVTVCNMFLFRLFVRRFCYYCPSLVLTNAGLTPNDFHSHRLITAREDFALFHVSEVRSEELFEELLENQLKLLIGYKHHYHVFFLVVC